MYKLRGDRGRVTCGIKVSREKGCKLERTTMRSPLFLKTYLSPSAPLSPRSLSFQVADMLNGLALKGSRPTSGYEYFLS